MSSRRAFLYSLTASLACAQQERSEHPYTIEKIIGSMAYAGAVAWFKDYLLIADTAGGKITKVDSEGPSMFRDDTHVSAIAADAELRVYLADARNHRLIRIDKKGKEEVLASEWEGKPLLGPTGIAVTKNNHVFFTDSAWASEDANKPRPYYGIFHVPPKGELSLVSKMTTRPNGIALSPDNKTLYVVDSDTRSVTSWDVDKSGAASNQRVLLKTKAGVPNGIVTGSDGLLYIAAKGIEVYTSAGKLVYQIELTEKPGDITFGDGNLANLYVAARTGLYRVRLGVQRSEPSPAASKGGGAN